MAAWTPHLYWHPALQHTWLPLSKETDSYLVGADFIMSDVEGFRIELH